MKMFTPEGLLSIDYTALIMNDVDGCYVKNKYDTTGMIQRGPDAETDEHFEWLKNYNSNKNNVPILLSSGRSLSQIKGIAQRSENRNLIIHEHGMGIYDPSTGVDVSVFDKVPELERYKDAVSKLSDLRFYLEDRFDEMLKELRSIGYKNAERILIAPGKQYSIAIDLPYEKEFEKSDRVDPLRFFKIVWSHVPDDYKNMMFTSQEDLTGLMRHERGSISVYIDSSAINFKPPVSKPTALKFLLNSSGQIMQKYHVSREEEVALIDDRDIESMQTMKGSIWAPADCSKEVREEVARRFWVNGSGYLSLLPNIDGEQDILMIINARNHDVKSQV